MFCLTPSQLLDLSKETGATEPFPKPFYWPQQHPLVFTVMISHPSIVPRLDHIFMPLGKMSWACAFHETFNGLFGIVFYHWEVWSLKAGKHRNTNCKGVRRYRSAASRFVRRDIRIGSLEGLSWVSVLLCQCLKAWKSLITLAKFDISHPWPDDLVLLGSYYSLLSSLFPIVDYCL